MLYLLSPWTAINLTDYFMVRKGRYRLSDFFDPAGPYGLWSRPGLIAYVVGVLAQIPFIVLPFYTGPAAAAMGGVDLSFVVGLTASAGLYLLLTRSASKPPIAGRGATSGRALR